MSPAGPVPPGSCNRRLRPPDRYAGVGGCRVRAGRSLRQGLISRMAPRAAWRTPACPPSWVRHVTIPPAIGVLLGSCLLAGCGSGSAAASSTTPTAYVATGANVANPGNKVAVVDTLTSTAQTPITTGTLPSGLGVTPDGKYVLVANKGQDTVTEIDVASGAVVKSATVGLEPDAVTVAPDGTLALVANFGDNTVTPVVVPSLRVGRPISVGRQPVALAVSPKGTLAMVANYQDGTVTPIDLPGLTTGPPVAAGAEPDSLYISPDGGAALVADFETSTVTPIALPSMTPQAAIPVFGNPTGIAGLRSSMMAYVSGGAGVTPLNLRTGTPGGPIGIGTTAECLAADPRGTSIWVCGGNGTLVHLDLIRRSVVDRVVVGGQPSAVVIAR